jgi:phage anti-repressor protein
MGGHNAYPTRKEVKTKILVFADRIEIYSKMFILTVKYNQMTNIENLGNYTIIEYNDGMDSHALTLDFGKHLEKMQPVIYHKWIGARMNKQGLT